MFERYTETARRAVFYARFEASRFGSQKIESGHLLLGLLRANADLIARLMGAKNVESLRLQIEEHYPMGEPTATSVDLPLTNECKRILHHATKEADSLKQKHIGSGLILLAITLEPDSFAAQALREHLVTPARIREGGVHSGADSASPAPRRETAPQPANIRDLTAAARNGALAPLIGRDREVERVIQILSRRTRNNAVLIGDPGVGKTAMVEGLAQRIADGAVPSTLADRPILAMDVSALIPPRRIHPEQGLEGMLAQATNRSNAILFVDGLFDLAAAGTGWGVVEAIRILGEPQLAGGGVQCIATGTRAGLRYTLERAPTLARHFEAVDVAPPTEAEAVDILSGLKPRFEEFHGVLFGPGVMEAAVRASGRFLSHRALPDRAIDLIDEAGARVRVRQQTEPRKVAEARKTARQLAREMDDAIARHDFEKARELGTEERRERQNIQRLLAERTQDNAASTILPEDIAEAVAARASVPAAAVLRVLQQEEVGEVERIARELGRLVPADGSEWLPFLAAFLAGCSELDADRLANAIRAVKLAKSAPPAAGSGA